MLQLIEPKKVLIRNSLALGLKPRMMAGQPDLPPVPPP